MACQIEASLCGFIIHSPSLSRFTISSDSHLLTWSIDWRRPEGLYPLWGNIYFLSFPSVTLCFLHSFMRSYCIFWSYMEKRTSVVFWGVPLPSARAQGWLSLCVLRETLCRTMPSLLVPPRCLNTCLLAFGRGGDSEDFLASPQPKLFSSTSTMTLILNEGLKKM